MVSVCFSCQETNYLLNQHKKMFEKLVEQEAAHLSHGEKYLVTNPS